MKEYSPKVGSVLVNFGDFSQKNCRLHSSFSVRHNFAFVRCTVVLVVQPEHIGMTSSEVVV